MSTQYGSKYSPQQDSGLTPVQIGVGVAAVLLVIVVAVILFRTLNNSTAVSTNTIEAHQRAKANNPNFSFVGAPNAVAQPGNPTAPVIVLNKDEHSAYH